jgi:hypothetical protein
MRLGFVALPLLVAMPACSPARQYEEAARSLSFSLDRVDPGLELALPLERSRITFRVTLGVENPSSVPFHVQAFEGTFRLETDGAVRPLGQVRLAQALDLPAGSHGQLVADLAFGYKDLAAGWPDVQAALRGDRPGAWALEGTLRAQAYGIPLQLPVRTRRPFGAAP